MANYNLPVKVGTEYYKTGNFPAIACAVRAIFYGLNDQSRNYSVSVEGLSESNLDSVTFALSGQRRTANTAEDYSLKVERNFGSVIDLPVFMYTIDQLLDNKVRSDIAKTERLTETDFDITGVKGAGTADYETWDIKISSDNVTYKLKVTSNPRFLQPSVYLNIAISERASQAEVMAAMETLKILADEDYRGSEEYGTFVQSHGKKPFHVYQVLDMDRLIAGDQPIKSKLMRQFDSALGDEFKEEPADIGTVTVENYVQTLPRYLAIADRIRVESKRTIVQLDQLLRRFEFYEKALEESKPDTAPVLEIQGRYSKDTIQDVKKLVSGFSAEKYNQYASDHVKADIIKTLLAYIPMMENLLLTVDSIYTPLTERFDNLGVMMADKFDPVAFFESMAQNNTVELAEKALDSLRRGAR